MIPTPRAGLVAATVLATAALAAGCGSDDDASTSASTGAASTSATTAAQKAADVAYVSYAYTDYVQAEEQGVKDAVTPGGGSVTMFNANFDPQKLTQQCQDAITSGRYNAIVLAPVNSVTAVPCVTAAKAAGIPVVSIESPAGKNPNAITPELDGVVGAVVLVPDYATKEMLSVLEQACKDVDPCRVIAEETPGDPFTTEYTRQAATLPNVDVVQKIAGMYDPTVIAKAMPDALAAHPDADVFMAGADSTALAALPAVKSAGLSGKLKLIGAGGSRQGAKAIADGTMFGSSGTWPLQEGRLAGEMAIKAINGQAIEPAGVNAAKLDTPEALTPATIDQFKPEWGAQ